VAIHSKAKIDEKILPDLFILDGGKAQLNIVKKLLAATVSKSPDSFGIDCRLLAYFEHVQFAALEK